MINQLVRYAPLLERLAGDARSLLEVGSGSDGIAAYLKRPCFGLEIRFPAPPDRHLIACRGTATALPFGDSSIDIVLIMDTLEHIPGGLRPKVIEEACRVARSEIIIGGPMGPDARSGDDYLAADHALRGRPVPAWLQEHLIERAPDVEDVTAWLQQQGWSTRVEGNENLARHLSLLKFEGSRYGGRLTDRLRKKAPHAAAKLALRSRKPPYYSWLITATR